MNERIKQLVSQAEAYANQQWLEAGYPNWEDYHEVFAEDYNEKFALLIVKECIDQCADNDSNDEWDKGVRWAANQITQHFGVEE